MTLTPRKRHRTPVALVAVAVVAGLSLTGSRIGQPTSPAEQASLANAHEGSHTDNHIPTLVISPATTHLTSSTSYTHCSTLRMVEEIVRVPLLGCAATATSMSVGFGLS